MLKCKDIAEHASDYLDQEQSWLLRMRFRLHLFICKNCRRYVFQLKQTIASLQLLKSRKQTVLSETQQQLARQLQQQVKKP